MNEFSERPQPVYKRMVEEGWLRARLQEFFASVLRTAGFHRMETAKTPMREVITVYADRPGIAIGRGGRRIKEITEMLKSEFNFRNPYLRIEKVSEPFHSAQILADIIARRIIRGERHRRVAFGALRRAISSGVKGIEIKISGRLGKRSREDRFRAGVIYRCGGTYLDEIENAVRHILLPRGSIGIKVRLVKPKTKPPGQPLVKRDEVERLLAEMRGNEEAKEVEEAKEAEEVEGAEAKEAGAGEEELRGAEEVAIEESGGAEGTE